MIYVVISRDAHVIRMVGRWRCMSVYKHPKTGKWYCTFRVTDWTGKRKQIKREGFSRRSDALAYERDYVMRESRNLDMSFGALVDIYMNDAKTRLRPSTCSTKQHIFDTKILPYFRDQDVSEITPGMIRQWQNTLIEVGYAPTYLRAINNQMTAVLNYAVRYYKLGQNPATVAGAMGSKNTKEMDYWTLDEFNRFIAGMEGEPTACMAFNILFWTGMREGELLALCLNDVDFDRGGIFVRHDYVRVDGTDYVQDPKTERGNRFVPAPAFLMDMIRDYAGRLYDYDPADRLFPFSKYWLGEQLRRCCARTGVKVIRVHDIRHSHVSLLVNRGADALLIARRVGHKHVSTTLETYSHLYPDRGQAVAADLDELWEQHVRPVDEIPDPDPDF